MSSISAQVIEALDLTAAVQEEWEHVFQASTSEPSTSLEWTLGLAHHYVRHDDRVFIVRLQRHGRAVGFVPLVARTIRVLRQRCLLLMPISEIFNTHGDLLLCEQSSEIVDALFDAVDNLGVRWDCLRLSNLLEGNPVTSLLQTRSRARRWTCCTRYSGASFFLSLPATFDAYLAARSAKFRNHARRAERKLRAAGPLRVVEITDAREFETAYAAIMEIEQASWKETHGLSIHAVPRQTAFYREWGPAAAAAGRLHLLLLTLNGKPIAHNIGYLRGGCYSYLKTSYAAKYRPLSPATFLRLRLIERLIGRGIHSIDFPGRLYEWERQWTDVVRWQHVVSIYPNTVRGRMLAFLDPWTHRSSAVRKLESVGTRRRAVPDEG